MTTAAEAHTRMFEEYASLLDYKKTCDRTHPRYDTICGKIEVIEDYFYEHGLWTDYQEWINYYA